MNTNPDGGPATSSKTHSDTLRERINAVLEEMKAQHAAAKQLGEAETDPLKRSRLNSQAFVMGKFAQKLERALNGN